MMSLALCLVHMPKRIRWSVRGIRIAIKIDVLFLPYVSFGLSNHQARLNTIAQGFAIGMWTMRRRKICMEDCDGGKC